jgi:hypothetical protein
LLSFARRFHGATTAFTARSRKSALDSVAEIRYERIMLFIPHTLTKLDLQMG